MIVSLSWSFIISTQLLFGNSMKYFLFWGIFMGLMGNVFCQIKPIVNDVGKLNYIPEYYWELDSNNLAIKKNTLSYPNSLKQLMKAPYKDKLIPFQDNYLSNVNIMSTSDVSSSIKNNLNLSE